MKKTILANLVAFWAVTASASTAKPPVPAEYAPNEILVKFSGPVANALEQQHEAGASAGRWNLSPGLDQLNARYRLKEIRPIFKDFKKNRQRLKALLKRDKALLTKKEEHILRRLKRAPKGAKVPDLSRIYKIELDLEPGESLEDAVQGYNNNPDVEYAKLNYIVSIDLTPNDPLYPVQWPLNNIGQVYPPGYTGTHDCDIDAPEAWDIETGNSDVVIAVVDTGVDYNHRDLQGNIWVNDAELNGTTGVDDDGNRYVDDIYGYDFINGDSSPKDDHGHGTHCSGTIAAQGDNGLDITGVCWNARIMALKFLSAKGRGRTSDAISCFYYAVENGADVISNSWGGGRYSEAMEEAINYAYSQGVLMVASAGNSDRDKPQYPAYYEHMISVAATNSRDWKAGFSNYGDWVDIAAPGLNVLSLRASGTSMGTEYDGYTTVASGTSMACPHVSGAFALLLSVDPEVGVDNALDILQGSADPIDSKICQSGRLNLFLAIQALWGLHLDRDYYSCSGQVTIRLVDSRFAGQGSHTVSLATGRGDSETVVLGERAPALGIFTGAIPITSGTVVRGDGKLQVAHGVIINASYEYGTDTAWVDCVPPHVFNVEIDAVGPAPQVTFETDEPTAVSVLCRLTCRGDTVIMRGPTDYLATRHTLRLTGVWPETDYFFVVEAADIANNVTVEDNNGACYAFTTDAPGDIYVPSQDSTLQQAIDHSWDGGTVWVAGGVYTGPGNHDIDFQGKSIAVRSEYGPQDCIIDCQNQGRAFYFHNAEGADSVLDGFTIINGRAAGGGAILCRLASPTITNCVITENSANEHGGGICSSGGRSLITNCTITGNSAHYGGGISCTGACLTIDGCVISDNHGYKGGAINCAADSNMTFINSTITDNHAGGGGAGISCYESSLSIVNCAISRNTAAGSGGIWCRDSVLDLRNCLISDNYATWYGGGIERDDYSGELTVINLLNCTVAGNTAGAGGGGIYRAYGAVTNCIFRDNSPTQMTGTPSVTFANVQGGWPGEGNIDADPLFVDPAYGGYHLMAGSPCIDAGTNEPNGGLPATDLDGRTRTVDGDNDAVPVTDMGVYEYDPLVSCMAVYPRTIEFYAGTEGPNPQDQVFSIANVGGGALNWSITYDCNWLQITADSGSSRGQPDRVGISVKPDVRDLAEGDYSCELIISDPCAVNSPKTVNVLLRVVRPVISVDSNSLELRAPVGGDNLYCEFLIKNDTVGRLTWTIAEDCPWLSVEPNSGTVSADGNAATITVAADITDLLWGRYDSILTISADEANSPLSVAVRLFVYRVWSVPSVDSPTIQSAIDAAVYADVVIVADGTYTGEGNRDIDFAGKAIALQSRNGPENCIINCQGTPASPHRGFYFHCGEGPNSVVEGFTITGGYADFGGAMETDQASPTIRNCIFRDNASEGHGGAVFNYYASPTMSYCVFADNSAWYGGAVCNFDASATLSNCIFSNNTADYGAGVDNEYGSPSVTNCTFSGNSAAVEGGGILNFQSSATVKNCILWDNTPQEIYSSGGTPTITYCDIQGGWPSIGNIDADPLFVDAASGDYHLLPGSPAIDAGYPPSDYSGEPWPNGGRVNMGAYGNTAEATRSPADFDDLALLCAHWLQYDPLVDIAPGPTGDGIINFLDFAFLADCWLR
ncbi:MAG: S8 family serine peptidase [Planctomycetota bacterium]|jgi:subtilisin family serine protease